MKNKSNIVGQVLFLAIALIAGVLFLKHLNQSPYPKTAAPDAQNITAKQSTNDAIRHTGPSVPAGTDTSEGKG